MGQIKNIKLHIVTDIKLCAFGSKMVKEKPGATSKGERSQNIQVAVRCRPTSQYEMKLSSPNAVEIDPKSKDITVRQDISYLDKGNNRTFQFDKVFGPKSK